MNRIPPTVSAENLTQFETLALASSMNLADGHARQQLTAAQGKIVADLPNLWAEAVMRPVEEIEQEAAASFFGMLGQLSHSFAAGRTLSCYSSSLAMEILARSLATASEASDAVALIHPTFDNIPDILRGVGLRLVPVEEGQVHDEDLPTELLERVGCVFITTPNNPTGRVMSQARLRRLAEQCAEHNVVLALDTCFRGFDPAAQFDHYAVLDASGCRWVVIEDTGKLWPTLELKIGWLVRSANVGLPIEKIHSDILLGTSPLIMLMVKRFAEDGADGGLAELQRTIADHRALVRAELADVPGVTFVDDHARVSVERLHVGSRQGMDVWSAVRSQSLYVLPCQKFHWARPHEGERMLRLALSRNPSTLLSGARVLRSALLDAPESQG
ncbi:enduracididine biosynthesis enzyme MppP [Streptomyces sp. NPDC057521]|uniref:enduracididine biosynthesis enzyme MppP n=1 Tax=Streptomyces sp. NPDC057521 TaxID=3346156 RepID=UPI0036905281